MDGPSVRNEAEYVASRLEVCRIDGRISNDAYLDAGIIQGALDMIANHIEMGVEQSEVQRLIREQVERAIRLEQKHPGIDKAVEEGR